MWLRLRAVHCSPGTLRRVLRRLLRTTVGRAVRLIGAALELQGVRFGWWWRALAGLAMARWSRMHCRGVGVAAAAGNVARGIGGWAMVTWPREVWCGASGKHSPAGGAHCGIISQHRMRHRIVAIGRGYERLVWPRAVPKVGKVGPNPAFERTRRFMASTWPMSVRRAAQLARWASSRSVARTGVSFAL